MVSMGTDAVDRIEEVIMSIRRIEAGPRMSQAVIHGNTVYLAGQVGAPGKSVTEQTKAVLATSTGCSPKPAPTSPSSCRRSSGWPT